MNLEIVLRKNIMRRIYVAFWLRRFFDPVYSSLISGLLLFGVFGLQVSIRSVLINMPSILHPISMLQFYSYAVTETEFFVQMALVGIIIWSSLTLFRLIKSRAGKSDKYDLLEEVAEV